MCCRHSGEAGKGKKRVWIVARQHPGESMAEWFVEGDLCCVACQIATDIMCLSFAARV